MKVGRKLANKILNVTKFVLGIDADDGADSGADGGAGSVEPSNPIDLSMLAKLDLVIEEATAALDGFDYARALERTESFFWWFCDNYVELVKGRGYGSQGGAAAGSARAALRSAIDSMLRLFAPFLPFAAEEAWSWSHTGSVHAQSWPQPSGTGGDPAAIDPTLEVLGLVRRTKTEAKVSQRAAVSGLVVTLPDAQRAAFDFGRPDLLEAGSIATLDVTLDVTDGATLSCAVTLAPAG